MEFSPPVELICSRPQGYHEPGQTEGEKAMQHWMDANEDVLDDGSLYPREYVSALYHAWNHLSEKNENEQKQDHTNRGDLKTDASEAKN